MLSLSSTDPTRRDVGDSSPPENLQKSEGGPQCESDIGVDRVNTCDAGCLVPCLSHAGHLPLVFSLFTYNSPFWAGWESVVLHRSGCRLPPP